MVCKRTFRVTPTVDEGLRAKEISLEMIAALAERALQTEDERIPVDTEIAMTRKDDDEIISIGAVTTDDDAYGFRLTRTMDDVGVRLLVELAPYNGSLF